MALLNDLADAVEAALGGASIPKPDRIAFRAGDAPTAAQSAHIEATFADASASVRARITLAEFAEEVRAEAKFRAIYGCATDPRTRCDRCPDYEHAGDFSGRADVFRRKALRGAANR